VPEGFSFTLTYDHLITLAALITALGVILGTLVRVTKPFRTLMDKVDTLDSRSKQDFDARQKQDKLNRLHTATLIAMLDALHKEERINGELERYRKAFSRFYITHDGIGGQEDDLISWLLGDIKE
jgi:hypothetical protein